MGFVSRKWEEEIVVEDAGRNRNSGAIVHESMPTEKYGSQLLIIPSWILTHLRVEDISWIYQNEEARSFDTKILNKQKD